MSISVNKYPEQKLEHFNDKDESLGFLNADENIDLRIQIKEQKISGYYLIFENKKIFIDEDGGIDIWPNGMYDTTVNLLNKFFDI